MAPRIDTSVAALLQPVPCQRVMRNGAGLDTAWRVTCMMACLLLIAGIFYLGEMPEAVGLLPVPYDKVMHFATFLLLTVLLGFAGLRAFPLTLFLAGISLGALENCTKPCFPVVSAAGWISWRMCWPCSQRPY